jgi:hypothetical protein
MAPFSYRFIREVACCDQAASLFFTSDYYQEVLI